MTVAGSPCKKGCQNFDSMRDLNNWMIKTHIVTIKIVFDLNFIENPTGDG
jgi:hypothetical protein